MNQTTSHEDLLAKIARRIPGHPDVIDAVNSVPREVFVPTSLRSQAYYDMPLPIGEGQTISQPSLVAMMTAELGLTEDSRVLEIGTGCGYQTAILSVLAREVFTIEVRAELACTAEDRLKTLGHANVHFKIGGGMLGWKEAAPFDAIIVTAAAAQIPRALVDQLILKGRMVLPLDVGQEDFQELFLLTKTAAEPQMRSLGAVRFVPIVARDPKLLDHV